jgi:hypothetical protein
MKQRYKLGTSKYISIGESFRRRFKILAIFFMGVVIIAAAFLYDFSHKKQSPQTPTSKTTVKNINFQDKNFSTAFFSFKDSEDWKLIQSQSTPNKFVFQKYLPNSDLVQHQLMVYVNNTPPSLELASSRVQVSGHCGKTYNPGELHKVMHRQLDGTTLLCDPEQGQFRVVLAKEGGDFNLTLKRADGTTANYIIIYQNQKIDPDPETVMRIASSFQSL